MRFRNGLLGSQMFVGRDLIGQLVLFHRSRIAGRLRWPFGVLADLVFEFVWQSVAPLPVDLPEK